MTAKNTEIPALAEEQNRHECDDSASRAAGRWPGPVPPLTGGELAWALHRVGFTSRLDGPEHVVLLQKRAPIVRIPLRGDEKLHPAMVSVILRTVGVTPSQLMEALVAPEDRPEPEPPPDDR